MKNVPLFAVGALCAMLAFVFSSCEKEGKYSPCKKIEDVDCAYMEKEYDLVTGEVTTTDAIPKYHFQEWNWDGSELTWLIEYYSNGTMNNLTQFTYDKKHRVTTIDAYDNYTAKVNYVDDQIDNIVFSKEDIEYSKITFNHDGKKVSGVVFSFLVSKAANDKLFQQIANSLLPGGMKSSMTDIVKTCAKQNRKDVELACNYVWEGDNVTRVDFVSDYKRGDYIIYTYDSKKNPLKGFFLPMTETDGNAAEFTFSKNNVTSITSYNADGSLNEKTTYSYTYDGSYPETRTGSETSIDGDTKTESTQILYYDYD